MEVTLTKEPEEFGKDRARSGRCADESEMVRAGRGCQQIIAANWRSPLYFGEKKPGRDEKFAANASSPLRSAATQLIFGRFAARFLLFEYQ
jgi:hypothetical protein